MKISVKRSSMVTQAAIGSEMFNNIIKFVIDAPRCKMFCCKFYYKLYYETS